MSILRSLKRMGILSISKAGNHCKGWLEGQKLHFPTLGAAEEAEADTWGSLAALAEDQP